MKFSRARLLVGRDYLSYERRARDAMLSPRREREKPAPLLLFISEPRHTPPFVRGLNIYLIFHEAEKEEELCAGCVASRTRGESLPPLVPIIPGRPGKKALTYGAQS